MLKKIVNGVEVEMSSGEETEIRDEWAANNAKAEASQYREDRKAAYPSIGDQLDMMFHDQQNGTSTWIDMIKKIKADHPKP